MATISDRAKRNIYKGKWTKKEVKRGLVWGGGKRNRKGYREGEREKYGKGHKE